MNIIKERSNKKNIFDNCNYRQIDVMPNNQVEIDYSYYSNGQLEFSAEYLNGKLDGLS